MRFSNYFFFFCGGVSQNHFLPIFSPFLAIWNNVDFSFSTHFFFWGGGKNHIWPIFSPFQVILNFFDFFNFWPKLCLDWGGVGCCEVGEDVMGWWEGVGVGGLGWVVYFWLGMLIYTYIIIIILFMIVLSLFDNTKTRVGPPTDRRPTDRPTDRQTCRHIELLFAAKNNTLHSS